MHEGHIYISSCFRCYAQIGLLSEEGRIVIALWVTGISTLKSLKFGANFVGVSLQGYNMAHGASALAIGIVFLDHRLIQDCFEQGLDQPPYWKIHICRLYADYLCVILSLPANLIAYCKFPSFCMQTVGIIIRPSATGCSVRIRFFSEKKYKPYFCMQQSSYGICNGIYLL